MLDTSNYRNLYILGFFFHTIGGLLGPGFLMEMTNLGDKADLHQTKHDTEALEHAARFRNTTQYDCVLLQRKNYFPAHFLALSTMRNMVHLHAQPRGYRTAVLNELHQDELGPDQHISQNLNVFTGLKGFATFLTMWGLTWWII